MSSKNQLVNLQARGGRRSDMNYLMVLSYVSASFCFILAWLAWTVLHRAFIHPLSRIPGPRLAAVSNGWYAYHVRNGAMLRLGRTLHSKYGPIVRVGPNEIWFNSKDAFSSIYGSGNGYDKSDFYLAMALQKPRPNWRLQLHFPDTLDLLAERDMGRYRLQRRLIGPIYQTSNVKRFEKAVDDVLKQVVSQLKSLQGKEVDLKQWMHIITVECLGAIVLSWSPGYLRDKSDWGSSSHSYLGWKRKSVFGLFPLAVVLESLSKTFGRAFSNLWGVTYKTPTNFKPFFPAVYQKCSRRINAALRPEPPKDNRRDLLADLIQLHKMKAEFNGTYLRRMAMTNFGAGHETTTSALISSIAMIGSHPTVQQRITTEICEACNAGLEPGLPISFDVASRLRYTQAAIREAQRLYPVIGMSLPRRVASGGLHLHGYYFPPGTTVGCNPVALHRNPDIFGQDAEKFKPERWLGDYLGDTDRKAMERCNLIWGGGARTCPGRHLAELVLHKVVPVLVKEFNIEVCVPAEDEMPYYFMAMLTGVKARFLPRGDVADPKPDGRKTNLGEQETNC